MNHVDTIRVDLPDGWLILPTDRAGIDALLAQRATEVGWQALHPTERRAAEMLVLRALDEMESTDVRFAAALMTLVAVEGGGIDLGAAEPVEHVVNSATVVVSLLSQERLGVVLPLTPSVLEAAMSLERPTPKRGGVHYQALHPPEILVLPAGPAVRVRRLQQYPGPDHQSLKLYSDAFLIPTGETPGRVVNVHCTTPHVDDSSLFARLFDAIAHSVRLYRKSEPTVL